MEQQLQAVIQENQTIQVGTDLYHENMQKIEWLQNQIQYYQDQIRQTKEQIDTIHDQAINIIGTASNYADQWQSWFQRMRDTIRWL